MTSRPTAATPKAAPRPAYLSSESQIPGKWRHPHLNEIVRRQNAATFGDRDMKKLLWNGAALAVTWIFGNKLSGYLLQIQDLVQFPIYADILLLVVRLFFALNMGIALYPIFRPRDTFSDIPLTPTQRALLGLDPSVTFSASASGSSYATPPRYRLSRSASPASRSTSPMSTGISPSSRSDSRGASFSPSNSPLLYKAMSNGSRDAGRGQSFGSSPLGRSSSLRDTFRDSNMAPATPSPAPMAKRTSTGMSNRWLYERSRRLSTTSKGF